MGDINKIVEKLKKSNSQDYANGIVATRDLLTALGLDTENNCGPDGLLDALENVYKDFADTVEDTADSIFSEGGGGFIFIVAKMLSDVLEGTIFAWSDQVLEELLAGKIAGTILSTAAAGLSVIPGIEIYLQYLAVKQLKSSLMKRNNVISKLKIDIINLIDLIRQYQDIFNYSQDDQFKDIKSALKEIERAELYLGIEAGRAQNNSNSLKKVTNTDNIEFAKTYIDRAINYLTSGSFGTSYLRIKEICKEYNFKASPPSELTGVNITGWYSFFKDMNDEIIEKYFTYSYTADDPRYEKDRAQKLGRYKNFLSKLVPHMPKVFNVIIMQQSFTKISNRILELFPISLARVGELSSLKNAFDEALGTAMEKLANGFTKSVDFELPRIKPADPNLNSLNSQVQLEENIIVLAPTTWKMVQTAGTVYSGLILSAIKGLKDVKLDIQATIQEKPSKWDVWLKQVKWVSELELVKAQLKPIISQYAGFNDPTTKTTINGVKLAAWIEEAGLQLDQLKQFIYEKSFDEKTKKPRKEPGEQAYKIAQKALIPLMTNITFLLSPTAGTRMLQQLQALRILLDLQTRLDYQELNLANNFISIVESHPYFPTVKRLMDQFLGALLGSPASELAASIAKGDLSTLATYFEAGEAISDLGKMFTCKTYLDFLDPDQVTTLLGKNPNLTFTDERIKKINLEMQENLQNLRNQKLQLERAFDKAHRVIEESKKEAQPEEYVDITEPDLDNIMGNEGS